MVSKYPRILVQLTTTPHAYFWTLRECPYCKGVHTFSGGKTVAMARQMLGVVELSCFNGGKRDVELIDDRLPRLDTSA